MPGFCIRRHYQQMIGKASILPPQDQIGLLTDTMALGMVGYSQVSNNLRLIQNLARLAFRVVCLVLLGWDAE